MKHLPNTVISGIVFFVVCIWIVPSFQANQTSTTGAIVQIRGGLGVVAHINNERGSDPFDDDPMHWEIHITGNFVLFGHASGTTAPGAVGVARTGMFPPAIGFGSVTITIEASKNGASLTSIQREGFMLGPFVFVQ